MPRYACECCGHRTLDEPPGGTYQICPVCFWEDAPFPDENWFEQSSNGVSLRVAQRHFLQFGAATADALDDVRPARDNEPRDESWQTLDEKAVAERKSLLAQIERVFHGVSRHGGVSLHESDALDDFLGREAARIVRAKDTDRRWQDVPERDLEQVGKIAFLDPIGWRYYLPAYMSWWLRDGESSDYGCGDSLLYSLALAKPSKDGMREYDLERFEMLNPAQSQATARFLGFVRDFGEQREDAKDARKALLSYWDRFA